MKKGGDFHIHTVGSDGVLTVKEILEYIKDKIEYICITDHDYLDSSIECQKIASDYSVKAIIGVEISTMLHDESVHILGYFRNDLFLNKLKNVLEQTRVQRLERAHKIKNLLKEHFDIDLDLKEILKVNSVTRGTIAREIIKQNKDRSELTNEYLFKHVIGKHCPAYVPVSKISPLEAINLIHECHGLAVLAHPTLLEKVSVDEIIQMNIDGIEAVYPLNKDNDEERFRKLANDNNLFITAGSDFHFFNDTHHGNLLTMEIKDQDLEKFIEMVNNLK